MSTSKVFTEGYLTPINHSGVICRRRVAWRVLLDTVKIFLSEKVSRNKKLFFFIIFINDFHKYFIILVGPVTCMRHDGL